MSNPFELTYRALFDIVSRDPRVSAIVRPRNAIDYMTLTGENPEKDSRNPADVPEIKLISSGAGFNLHETNSTTRINRRYQWLLATGDYRLNAGLYQLEWSVMCALVEWRRRLSVLTWPEGSDWRFVKKLTAGDVNEGTVDRAQNLGLPGWTALWSCEIEMHFRNDDLYRVVSG